MIYAQIGPDPDARSLRAGMIGKDAGDALAHAIREGGECTSAEVHRDASVDDIAHGNGKVVGHNGSSSPRYYKHWDDPDWAVIFNTDCPYDPLRGRELLERAGYIPSSQTEAGPTEAEREKAA